MRLCRAPCTIRSVYDESIIVAWSCLSIRKGFAIVASSITTFTRRIGRTDRQVFRLCIGGILIINVDEANSDAIIRMALDAGINLLEMSRAHGNSKSERNFGRILRTRRREGFLEDRIRALMRPRDAGKIRYLAVSGDARCPDGVVSTSVYAPGRVHAKSAYALHEGQRCYGARRFGGFREEHAP